MNLYQLEFCLDQKAVIDKACHSVEPKIQPKRIVSLETEIPEALYIGMKDYIAAHPSWDQYHVMRTALANFLFQNGCEDRVVTESYLNDLFMRSAYSCS